MNLLILGLGYSAQMLVEKHAGLFSRIEATVRSPAKAQALGSLVTQAHVYSGGPAPRALAEAIARADLLLATAAPGEEGDPFLVDLSEQIAGAGGLRLIQYLSTVGVYGDHGGAWIDETAETRPANPRGQRRVAAENAWFELATGAGKAVQVHRLAGIYGPGRNALADLREGTARRIDKSGQVFNRIHVEDIAGALAAGIEAGCSGAYNICDDEPAPSTEVVAFAASLLGIEPPAIVPFEQADLSDMARSFYGENKRCLNARAKAELGFGLRYPDFRAGLRALYEAGEGRA